MHSIGEHTLSFTDFNLQKEFIASIKAAGYQSPTPLQSQLIPLVAERKSALVLSQSVAGKTGAILIPAINYILENPNQEKRGARILILTSRRDRVSQINYTIKRLSKEHTMRFGFIVSGRPYQTQMRLMRRPLDIMIATPGRLNDLMENKKADFSKLEMLIVDDFSSIYRKNLHGLIGSILNQVSDDCPSLVFVNDDDESTAEAKSMFPQSINIIVSDEKYDELNNNSSAQQPSEHPQPEQQHSSTEGSGNQPPKQADKNHKTTQTRNTNKADSSPKIDLPKDLMTQDVYVTDDYTHKIALMDHFLDEFSADSTVIYTSTGKAAQTLQENLTNHGHSADIAHELSADQLAKGEFETLIISDQDKMPDFSKLPKGFDTHLVHFDLPFKTINFIKRLHNHDNKRDKAAVLIVDGRNYNELKQIEKTIGNTLDQATVPGLEPLQPFVNKSKPQNRNNNKNHKGNTKNHSKNNAKNNTNRKKPQNSSQKNKNANNDKSKRQRKGPFGRLNGSVHRKQDSNNNTGGRQRTGTNNNQKRRPKVKVGVSSRGTSAPTSDRAWQSDFAEPKERQATSKKVVIRYKDKKTFSSL